jgi:hypothetical protein
VWTGFEMIVWGGFNISGLNTGGRYNPSTDSWTATSTANAPIGRGAPTAVWTGFEMIVWGGNGGCAFYMCVANTGGRYNPTTDSWTDTSITNAPSARANHTAVWTGSEMIVWGGAGYLVSFNTGGRYCAQPPSVPARLGNISTRAFVQTGDNVMIGGFIVVHLYLDAAGRAPQALDGLVIQRERHLYHTHHTAISSHIWPGANDVQGAVRGVKEVVGCPNVST